MEEQEGGDAVDWREAFDDLLVFEQDFDTAMQILMFQDEKVARLSLEEPSLTMRRTGRRAKSRTSARSSSKKRRRTEASEAAREEPPIPPLGSCTQSSGLWSSVASSAEEEEATQSPWTQQYSSVEMQEYAAPQFGEAYEDVGAPGTGETGGKPSETGRNARVNGAATTAVSSSDGANREKGNSSVGTSPTAVSSLFQTRSGKVATVSSGHVDEVGANVMFEGNNVEVAANLGECFSAQNREHKVQVTTGVLTVNSQNLQPDDVDFSKASGPAYFPDDAENNAAKVQYRCHGVSTIGKNNSGATVSSLFQTAAGDTVAISKARLTDYTEKLFKELSPDPQPLQTTTVTNPHHANRCHTMASTLFTTGSGKAVSVSKVRLQAYEAKLRSEEEMVAASTTSERRDVHGAGGGVNAKADSAATVPSLFQTGSGKAVSVSKVRLQAYEAKLRSEEEMVAASTTSERRDVHGAGGGVNAKADSAATVPSLFQTGSGKAVSVSKVRLQAYEAKLRSEEEMVAASTTSERRDVHGAGGGVNAKADSAATVPSLFQTGSGKAVSVSKVRLQAYEAKLRSEEEMVAASTTSERRDVHGAGGGVNAKADSAATVPSLFQTGSGKAVSVSKVRLQAYEAKLRSEEEMVAASTTSERRDVHGAGGGVNAKADSAATVPSLFQTGSGKAVSVSKVRLQAYEAKLRSEEEMVAASTTSERRDVHGAGGGVNAKADSAATVPSLFQTGSGKAVSVSKVRLQAYEAKLRSEEEMVAASTTSERRDVHGAGGGVNAKADSAATVPSLFQTGSGKAVSVSKVRLQAYEAKLRSEEEMVAASTTSERRDVHGAGGGVNAKADSAATVPSLFQTGSGKAVSVSKVRLQAYEAKLRSEEEMVAASTTSERRDVHGAGGGVNAKADSAATVPSLFQTGSGKAVSVSKVRLQAYEAKLRSEEEMVAASTTSERRDVHGAGGGVNAKADSAATVPSLFQTGSGKAVSVSKVRLQAYEARLRSEEEMVAASTTSERRDVHGAGGGVNAKADSAATVPSLFQTGSGKAVSVSKVRLQAYEARLRSEEEMVAASTTSERRDVHGAGGGVNAKADSAATVPSLFQTGSGKAVSVSKVRLQAYEARLRSEEEMVAASTTSERRDVHGAGGGVNAKADSAATVPSLFQTGSGKAVSVSKVRLQAYEAKLRSEEEMVAASTTSERRDVHGAGGGVNAKADSAATVPSLFQTGSGKAVSVSKVRLQAYEAKLRSEEEMVAASTTSERRDVHGAGGGVNAKADSAATVPSLFQTGSGKAVSVSKVRLQAYEARLRSEEEMVAASTTSERRDVHGAGGGVNAKADSAATVPSLFQTGSGKAVSVSKVRLQAYEARLRSEEEMVAASTTSERRDVHGAGGGVNAKADSAATVPSLFQTGSGKAVSVSKVRLQAYEAKLRSEEEMVAASTTSERRDVHGAGGGVNAKADSAATVPSLFQTGSGKAVSVSKVRLQAYEAKLRSEEEMVAASTTSERRDVHGAGGGVNAKADSAATVPSLFQTGSGKAVSVSKVRLQAYEAKLRSEEEMVAASTTSERRDVHGAGGGVNAKADSAATVPSLFQTGSGKAVSVSKVRLQAYEARLRSEEEMVAASTTSERRDVHGAGGGVNAKADSAATVPSLFQTGSGKAVSVSKVRLQAYEARLRSEEEMVAASTTSERRDVHGAGGGVNAKADSAATVPSLFQTGSGKAVSVSKVRLQAYEAKLRSEEEMVAASTTSERRDVHGAGGGVNAKADSAATVPSLFQTGSGKAVSVSKVRLQAYEAKLRSEEEMVAASTTSERRDVHGAGGGVNAKADSAATVPSLFQTGSGKAVSVSKVRLQAYEAKLRSEEEMVAASTTSERRDVHGAGGGVNAKADSAATVPSLFQTGSGKAVSVSKVRLQAYEAKLRSEEEMVAASTTSERRDVHGAGGGVNAKADSAATVPSLFQTGSGKAVSVSKVRLQAYEAKLRSEEEMVAASTTSERRDVHGAGGGVNAKADSAATVPSLFQTGSGKAVSVSKVRLQAYEAKLRSEEEMVAASTTSERRDVHGAGGGVNAKADSAATVPSLFQTGSGKAVSVSKVRLQAYEAKLRSEEEMVAASTTSERRDVHGAGGGVNAKADSAATVPSLFQTGSGKAVSVSKVRLQAYEAKLRSKEEPMSDEGRGAGSVSGDIEAVKSDFTHRLQAKSYVSSTLKASKMFDAPLAAMLWKSHAKSSLVGTKIATWNAGLQNSTEGIDPLECAIVRESQWKNPLLAKEDLTQWPYLLLRYNSTRRVRFETRLGVEKLHFMIPTNPRARKQQPQLTFSMLKSVPLKSLEVGGGMVRSVRIRVTRISPVLHLQANEWTLGPRILCEEQLPTYFQLRSEYGQASMQRKIQQHGVGSGAEDWLNDDQIDVPPPIPFIKMDVECTHPSNGNQGVGCGILTVWRPSEELLSGVLREGAEYFASSLTVNWKVDGGRGQDAFVRLGSTKHSGFEEVHDDLSLDDKEAKGAAQLKRNQRVCVDVQQATTDYRANFESDRRNERRPTIDVCVCVVLVTTRETQDGSSIAAKRQAEVSLLDPSIKPKESRYVEHVFVTDKSRHLMSIRVSGMEVSMLKKKTSPLKRGSSSSFAFRRGSKRIWKEGAVLCLSGLEVSHYDEQLRVLDCVLVESTQIVAFPSKNSPFWNHFQCLQREAGISTSRRSASEPTSSEFFEELAHLKKYVERDILRMDFVPSQECDEHYVEVVEQERLTQDLQAHEGGGEQTNESSDTVNRHLRWDGTVVKILPLPGSSKFIFPRDVIALVCICIRTDDNAFRSVYLTQEAVISMQALLQGTDVEKQLSLKEGGPTEDDAALVLCTMKMLNKTNADKTFQFEVRQATNERLINSWKPWDRLHASYWVANTVTSAPPTTD
ncbi:hypothetical protein PRNP1_003306 [Phytophthora ramorum]